jgi:phosphatidylglycerophosphate synthase
MSGHVREHRSLLAEAEKRLLVRIAGRLPGWVTSDQLTVLALGAMCAAGAGFALARWDVRFLWIVIVALAVNWFGDSLDGTLARVRRAERPRYGFYVDHVVDIVGAAALFAGMACSTFMSPIVALSILVLYLLVSAEVFLATAAHGVFRLSVAGIGPTELRILLAVGVVALRGDPRVDLGAAGQYRLFDVGGAIAACCLAATLAVAVWRNIRTLARMEPPRQRKPSLLYTAQSR